jgi:predicted RND superfamily exporter protein
MINKISKNSLALILIFSAIYSYGQVSKKLWTVEQVKLIAKKYGMEEHISDKRNTALLYYKKEDIENYFQKQSEVLQRNKEFKEYLEKTKTVRNYDDYLKLVGQYPMLKAQLEKSQGGKIEYEKYNAAAKKEKWRIYRNTAGGLSFKNAALPVEGEELKWGKRVDDLTWEK